MPPHDEEVPNIQACCANCKFTYNMAFGYDCPRCHGTPIAWARLITNEEYARALARNRPSFRATECNWTLTEGEKLDVAELYRMYALEDKRTDQGGIPCK